MDGFLNLNKPAGFTSHDCVAKVRRLLRMKRVGHAGTLDPAATGVLPIALGRATRLLQFLPTDKAYDATIRFGVQTTTDDLEGEVLRSHPCPTLTLEAVQQVLPNFQGILQQIPPNYSAIQVQGQRLYDLARAGQTIQAAPRSVEVFKITLQSWRAGEYPELDVAITCGPGTYIRAIARDLGTMLGVGGTLAQLLRTASSGFSLAESLSFEQLTHQIEIATFQPTLPEQGILHLPIVSLPQKEAQRWCQGQKIPLNPSTPTPAVRVHLQDGPFLGIGQVVDANQSVVLRPEVVLGWDALHQS